MIFPIGYCAGSMNCWVEMVVVVVMVVSMYDGVESMNYWLGNMVPIVLESTILHKAAVCKMTSDIFVNKEYCQDPWGKGFCAVPRS